MPDTNDAYKGADAGRIVMGIGAAAGTSYSHYQFFYRQLDGSAAGRIIYFQNNFVYERKRDYENSTENGVIQSVRLAPGNYEIYNFDIFLNGGNFQFNFKAPQDFSIKFAVHPGETVYLGNYQANRVIAQNLLGMRVHGGAVFRVSDRGDSEVATVYSRLGMEAKGPFTNAVPNVKETATPFLIGAGDPLKP